MSATVTQTSTTLRATSEPPHAESLLPPLIPGEQDKALQGTTRGDRNGTLKLRGIPTFSNAYDQRKWMKEHMAAAFRFFGKQGYNEGISGHISMRDPVLKDHFWINPFGKHFSLMKASELVLVDSEGYVTEGGNQATINEAGFMIHSQIHKARPDVVSAAHTHGVYGKTWSTFGKPVEMLSQGMFFFFFFFV